MYHQMTRDEGRNNSKALNKLSLQNLIKLNKKQKREKVSFLQEKTLQTQVLSLVYFINSN